MAGLRGNLPAACWLTGATVLAMAGVRAVLRAVTLAPYQTPEALKVTGEYSPLVVFLLAFALGLAGVGYLITLYRRAGKEA
jgi:cytochrome b561